MKIDFTNSKIVTGTILHKANTIELEINKLIFAYFLPTRETKLFKEIALNPLVISMSSKIKILTHMVDFDKDKIIQTIRNLNNLRNAVAHNNFKAHVPFSASGLDTYLAVSYLKNGRVESTKLEDLLNDFNRYYSKIDKHLQEYQNKLD